MEKSQERGEEKRKQKKVALVHDFLVSYGGAERVFEEMARMFPEAPLYTLLYDEEKMRKYFPERKVITSWLSRLPKFLKKRYRFFLPFFPVAVESFDLRDFDLVLSSSGAWSKGLVARLNTKHIAYIHSPMRYAWDYHEEYLVELGAHPKRRTRLLTRMLLSYLRLWDRQAALRPDLLIANSRFTAARIKKYYQRDCAVVYPGVLPMPEANPTGKAAEASQAGHVLEGYFLVVARLTAAKKIMAVVEAFNKLGLPLVVVGEGREKERLERSAGKNIRFIGFVEDSELVELYRGARALVFPSEEDFGLTAVEALSFGTPVIALDYGGIREIVRAGATGEFFHKATPALIAEGIRRFLLKEGTYDEDVLKNSVAHFTKENFRVGMQRYIESI